MKECYICNLQLDFSFFYKSKKSKDGFYPYCKDCQRKKRNEWDKKRREGGKIWKRLRRPIDGSEIKIEKKICRNCEEEKSVEFFGKDKRKIDKTSTYCKECCSLISRARRILKPEEWEKRKDKNFINYRLLKGIELDLPRKRHRTPEGTLDVHGYRQFRGNNWKNHPCSDSRGRVMEHRLVMYNHLKRSLLPGETIHHKNGIRHDNRIENLELWSKSHPPGQRVEDKIKWCQEFLELYGYEVLKKS